MWRIHLSMTARLIGWRSLALAAALLAGGCATDTDDLAQQRSALTATTTAETTHVATLTALGVDTAVLPAEEELIYRSMVRLHDDNGTHVADQIDTVSLTIRERDGGRHIIVGGREGIAGAIDTDAAGVTREEFVGNMAGLDLLQQLPPADGDLMVGHAFESAAPSLASIRKRHLDGDHTVAPHVVSMPYEILSVCFWLIVLVF
ncbi:MAG: hypothetical protein QF464_22735, partial [Myxococcota bacterium]|nr:hypothetical protein [Myxococcota bacterium]